MSRKIVLIGEVYRGYSIRSNFVGDFWVEKGGALICWVKSLEEARTQINKLLD